MDKIIDFDINEDIEDSDKISQIEELCRNNIPLNVEDVEVLLGNLSYMVRKQIADYEGTNLREYSYSNKCDLAQSMMCYYLNSLGIKVNPVNTNNVISGTCGHSLAIASFETTQGKKDYLLDPTYMQFFGKENCDVKKFVVINNRVCVSPDPGFFVVKSGKQDIVLPLLKNGYIEFTEEVAKVYGDSFFKTKQGVEPNQISKNEASGSSYIKWFTRFSSTLSKTEEELNTMNLLIKPIDKEKERSK